jgi:GDP-L-fucose synthase
MINKNNKIYIAGHNGMVGSAIIRKLRKNGIQNIVTRNQSDLDLTDQSTVRNFLKNEKPEYVVIAAAKVGGILANNTFPAEFIFQNLMIQSNLIHGSFLAGINNLLFLGSSCIYPKNSQQPIKEEYLLNGYLEETNEPYAIAKIAGIKLCESYNRQYDTDYRSIMPTNLYGANDNFHDKNSHVIPSLIKKFHAAKEKNEPLVEIWGSGNPMREFMHVDDMADASVHIMNLDKVSFYSIIDPMLSHINIGTGEDISIRDLSQIIKQIVGYRGEIYFNTEMPDGTFRKLLDVRKLNNLGWKNSISLIEGLEETYKWFTQNTENLRV